MKIVLSLIFVLFLNPIVIFSSYPSYIESPTRNDLIRDPIGQGDYLNPVFTSWIDRNQVNVILEIGSRDAIDALDLSRFYKAHVFAFECNPQAIEICQHNIGLNPNITLVPFAAWDQSTSITFYPTIPGGKLCVIGTSSLFKFDPKGPIKDSQIQGEITVQAIRLDEWMGKQNIHGIDLVCIDAQGASLQVLRGMGKKLSTIKYIIAEAEYQPYYIGEALYPEIDAYLRMQGFTAVGQINHHNLYADVLFIRNDLLN